MFGFVYFVKYSRRFVQKTWTGGLTNVSFGVKSSFSGWKVQNSFSDTEQTSSKYFFTIFSSKRYLARVFLAMFNRSSTYHHILSFFWLNCYWFFCKFAGLWACLQSTRTQICKRKPNYISNIFVWDNSNELLNEWVTDKGRQLYIIEL